MFLDGFLFLEAIPYSARVRSNSECKLTIPGCLPSRRQRRPRYYGPIQSLMPIALIPLLKPPGFAILFVGITPMLDIQEPQTNERIYPTDTL